ncbi:L-alanine-DL-glutamate epimerase-like enolase superfamily enzyme [Streptosporangium becharense]|uniref:L-alanine-DL-glutamate epimerase-like enolase superfamily enzyme n=1 Tax=Streptosporangium becharense TaxID=1816182 RepID=A0A7W9ILU5_9ACTN|nr:enolase C-terminal domain-like protein [Streptosporangium becharense]MBB2910344.1 L-alanine-DL-glutamate epimerase-like enolase superfamily enzyme [Streptosporangium becharense]MBB5823087.1 L-alanine-DL-glutamate epimerase-like enolase superfamily enzyme [Streptosporangium becharense]
MRITHVESYRIFQPATEPGFVWRDGLLGSPPDGEGAVLRIATDEGVEGVALAPRRGTGPLLEDLVERVLRAELVGQDPLRREWLWHRMWELDRTEEFPLYLLGLVDVALWDLAGRHAGLPVWQLLGGYRTSIPAYASTVTYSSIKEYLDIADQALELGYPAIKLHAWGDARRDAKLSIALREHVGDDVPLMFDGSAGFDLPDAVHLGHALSDAGYLWYEEPMREFSVTAYKRLADAVTVPLLVAETSDGAHMNSADFIHAGAATFGVRAGTQLRGGFTGSMRTAHLADAYRLRAEVHGPEIPNRHLCMAISNTTYYESLVFGNPITRESGIDDRGFVHAPTGPGVALPAGLDYPSVLQQYVDRDSAAPKA